MAGIDIGNLRELLRGEIDTRRWVETCVVDDDEDAVDLTADGCWLDCTVVATGRPLRAEWPLMVRPGGGGGMWTPPPRAGDLIDVVCSDGKPGLGVATGMRVRLDEDDARKLPAAVLAEPDAVHLIGVSERVIMSSDKSIAAKAPLVELGDESLAVTAGVVQGECIDTFTGATFATLGQTSAVVRAKK